MNQELTKEQKLTIIKQKQASFPQTPENATIRKLYTDLLYAVKKDKQEREMRLQFKIFNYIKQQGN